MLGSAPSAHRRDRPVDVAREADPAGSRPAPSAGSRTGPPEILRPRRAARRRRHRPSVLSFTASEQSAQRRRKLPKIAGCGKTLRVAGSGVGARRRLDDGDRADFASFHTEFWVRQQEVAFTHWLNATIDRHAHALATPSACADRRRRSSASEAAWRSESMMRGRGGVGDLEGRVPHRRRVLTAQGLFQRSTAGSSPARSPSPRTASRPRRARARELRAWFWLRARACDSRSVCRRATSSRTS